MSKELNVSDETVTFENSINLKRFPPKIRKVAKYMLETDQPITITQACTALNLNLNSIMVMMSKARRNGLDFLTFIDEQSTTILRRDKLAINKSLVNGAVLGSHKHQKLYYQLTGDLKETTNINVGTLAIGINITGVNPQDQDRAAGVIDVEPVIPKGK